ncbi:hypothetical protein J6590_079004 [Homalodisca vitripennis]|nr:hypothetical protein J6590_079004 [Homalodisca vitripennis]
MAPELDGQDNIVSQEQPRLILLPRCVVRPRKATSNSRPCRTGNDTTQAMSGRTDKDTTSLIDVLQNNSID